MEPRTLVVALTGSGPAREALAAEQIHLPDSAAVAVTVRLGELVDAGRVDPATATAALDIVVGFDFVWHPSRELLARVWELRGELTPDRAACVALAEHLDGTLVTDDDRIAGISDLTCEVRVLEP